MPKKKTAQPRISRFARFHQAAIRRINERLILLPFVIALCLYIYIYGNSVTDGFQVVKFGTWVLIIYIPIIIIDGIKLAVECSTPTRFKKGKEDIAKVTVIIPTKDGGDTLKATITDLLKKFKPKQIIVASNGSTDKTVIIAQKLGVRVLDIPKAVGKIDAINAALSLVTTPYCMTMDDDVMIGNAIIPTNLLRKSAGIAFRVLPIESTWVTKLQAHEYRKSMDIGKSFHNGTGTVQNISGAIGLFKTKELIRQIDLHTGEFSGEDLQRTLLIHLSDEKGGVVVSESIVMTDVPKTVWELFKQRVFGWSPGFFTNTKNFIKLMGKRDAHFKIRFEAFYSTFLVVITDPLRLISLPIIIFYPSITLLFYVTYVILEAIPYFKMGAKEPVWVLLLAPIYGLFTFVARTMGFMVFLYRRVAVKIARMPRYDDYHTVALRFRIAGLFIAGTMFTVIMAATLFVMKPVAAKNIVRDVPLAVKNFNPNITQDTINYSRADYFSSEPSFNPFVRTIYYDSRVNQK
jgi:cellulose synthase/poly-beta-1,6-N-acetylglucosamine synthase-like glycosyltransferase